MVDHGFPGFLAGKVNQDPLLQAAQHGTVQFPEIMTETKELVGAVNSLPKQQVQLA